MIKAAHRAPENLAVLAALHAASFDKPWSAGEFDRLLAMPGAVALMGGEGFILVRRAADEAEIITIAVAPMARRQGHASRLIMAAADRLHRTGAQTLFLEVDTANVAALNLYRKMGFERAGHRPGYYRHASGASSDALVLRAKLPLAPL